MSRDLEIRSGQQTQQRDLLILAELSGIQADTTVYRIIIELLSLGVEPDAIYKLLRYIRRSSKSGKQNFRKNFNTPKKNS